MEDDRGVIVENMSSWDDPENSNCMSVEKKEKGAFYEDAAQYWSRIPATVDGMLGGYGFISKVDIQGSNLFLKRLFRLKVPPGNARALDCGAGIGRITEHFLLNHFQKVDLVEQNPAFVNQARTSLESHKNMGNFYCAGLQDFTPEPATYDVIWCQWVLGHLKDDDLIAFLHGCILGLKDNGIIVIKENTTTSGKLDEDPTDSSVTRPLEVLNTLIQQAGLRIAKQKRQENFPRGLYPVYMIATRPSMERSAYMKNVDSTITLPTETRIADEGDLPHNEWSANSLSECD
ncbi:N-terminal Xaa-Pro-Lys N-methyltransferase 1-A [Thrips palmi]|uniref:Alpha N-terminal protein methyltransferase 1 n=1 Tax=Thrips palmi TaxID=161013 RepID=A0A6P8XX55_THRPL|nr:N-terminal Xaa-Pro-Lys N-methyltransferase 1-A [Thrips palmi]XP_034231663.1 N-terminal Xaa-Pro-Lys N-methyltransferase 1-A [Thrips palmi]